MVVLTVALMILASNDEWRAEVIPLMLFGMTMAIAYDRELALLLTAAVTLIAAQAIGLDLRRRPRDDGDDRRARFCAWAACGAGASCCRWASSRRAWRY